MRPYNPQGRALDGAPADLARARRAAATRYEVDVDCRPVAGGYLVRLAGVDDREAAAALTLGEVRVARAVAAAARARASTTSRTSSAARSRTRTAARWASSSGTFWNGAHDVADGGDGADGAASA